jgi:hypothetical protein
MRTAIAGLLMLMAQWCVPAPALVQPKIPVLVTHIGDDQLGAQYAFEVREAIRASQGMRLLTEWTRQPHIKLGMASVAADARGSMSSAIATVVAYDSVEEPMGGTLITWFSQICGRDRLQSCARSLMAGTDTVVNETLSQRGSDLWRSLFWNCIVLSPPR